LLCLSILLAGIAGDQGHKAPTTSRLQSNPLKRTAGGRFLPRVRLLWTKRLFASGISVL
jgi:hypothetical protein